MSNQGRAAARARQPEEPTLQLEAARPEGRAATMQAVLTAKLKAHPTTARAGRQALPFSERPMTTLLPARSTTAPAEPLREGLREVFPSRLRQARQALRPAALHPMTVPEAPSRRLRMPVEALTRPAVNPMSVPGRKAPEEAVRQALEAVARQDVAGPAQRAEAQPRSEPAALASHPSWGLRAEGLAAARTRAAAAEPLPTPGLPAASALVVQARRDLRARQAHPRWRPGEQPTLGPGRQAVAAGPLRPVQAPARPGSPRWPAPTSQETTQAGPNLGRPLAEP